MIPAGSVTGVITLHNPRDVAYIESFTLSQ
jgi:hypothetical protein